MIEEEMLEFMFSALENDTRRMKRVLDNISRYLDVNQVIEGKTTTALHVAVRHENLEMARMLMTKGANPNLKDTKWGTSLHYAVKSGRADLTQLVASHKFADVNATNDVKMTPLHMAITLEHYDVVKALLSSGADINVCDGRGFSPLVVAVITDDFRLAVILLNYGADVNYSSKNLMQRSVFQVSLCHSVDTISEVMLTYKPDLKYKDNCGRTALHHAVVHQGARMVEQLLERGADATDVTVELETPLHLLLRMNYFIHQEGRLEIAKLLVRYGADVNAMDRYRWTPLLCAIYCGRSDVARYLLERGADPNTHGIWSPLYLALTRQNEEMARLLIDKGADVRFLDEKGKSLAYLVNSTYRTSLRWTMLELLFKRGCVIVEQDDELKDPAHYYLRLLRYRRNFDRLRQAEVTVE